MKCILIIEDDANLSRGIAFAFEREGYGVMVSSTLARAREICADPAVSIDLLLLDIGLPDGDGLDFCRELRAGGRWTPVIMLTANDMETDEVAGLMAGADDYITKPFSLSILCARVEAVLRRPNAGDSAALRSGELRLDLNKCTLYKNEDEIPISPTEFRMLKYFMSNPMQALSKEQLLETLWDAQGNYVDENTLSVNISRLRAKIGDGKRIKTVHGMGYIWVSE